MFGGYGPNAPGSGYGPMVGSCEDNNEPFVLNIKPNRDGFCESVLPNLCYGDL
jgi:hypothetical protein